MEKLGGSVDMGDSYASNFLVINPQEKVTEGDKTFTVTMKVDSSMSGTVSVYKTTEKNAAQWHKVDADIEDGIAKMQQDQGKVLLALLMNCVSMLKHTFQSRLKYGKPWSFLQLAKTVFLALKNGHIIDLSIF